MRVSQVCSNSSLVKCVSFTGLLALLLVGCSVAQETVFNVPSGDVLDRGKVYTEFDFSYRPDDALKTYTPRVVVGLGKRFESASMSMESPHRDLARQQSHQISNGRRTMAATTAGHS